MSDLSISTYICRDRNREESRVPRRVKDSWEETGRKSEGHVKETSQSSCEHAFFHNDAASGVWKALCRGKQEKVRRQEAMDKMDRYEW